MTTDFHFSYWCEKEAIITTALT